MQIQKQFNQFVEQLKIEDGGNADGTQQCLF